MLKPKLLTLVVSRKHEKISWVIEVTQDNCGNPKLNFQLLTLPGLANNCQKQTLRTLA